MEMTKGLVVKILKNGKIIVETEGMHDFGCISYVEKICEALDAVPLNQPEFPQPVFNFSAETLSESELLDDNNLQQANRLFI